MKIKTHLKWWGRGEVFITVNLCLFVILFKTIFYINPAYKCEIRWSYLCHRTQPASWSEGIPCSTGVCECLWAREGTYGGTCRRWTSVSVRRTPSSSLIGFCLSGLWAEILVHKVSPMSHGESVRGWCVQTLWEISKSHEVSVLYESQMWKVYILLNKMNLFELWFLTDINKS